MPKHRQSLTLTLLQARESAMRFFRPQLNLHNLTEQQWRVIRLLSQHGELESHMLAHLACILKPSLSGVLLRLERDGMVLRRKMHEDQRRVLLSLTEQGLACFESMRVDMEKNYRLIQQQLGDEKLALLLGLLDDLRKVKP
ncbi:homoprotocatechuate degradation operon regulator HpaR [Pseudomonas hunanensis]|uniref:Homoprotocatechuate degradation operon regulator HpaR n=1 Tax=Pseudomonas hunanensis TaxID=1247546 RepID=A0ABD6N204_9PSED|nr:homoprotocatechuate degradation operon regulator HpaR [Pseudomonas hunanensis]NWL47424.1 homoprotocatechuate degradation operon regulator HpaR [Pseudomonas hunanensis]